MSFCPWQPKYSKWYVLMWITGDVGKVSLLLMTLSCAGQFCVQDILCGPTLQAGRHL